MTNAAIDRDDARLERIQRVYNFVPLSLYDEVQKLAEIAVREFIEERDRYRDALVKIRMLTVEVGDSVEAASLACDIAMEALGE